MTGAPDSRVGLLPAVPVLAALALALLLSRPAVAAEGDWGWGDEFATPGADGTVRALLVVGDDLYAAGDFTEMDGVPLGRIGRWDGTTWHALGEGLNGSVNALAVWQGMLVAGGAFTEAGGQPAWRVAAWTGSDWQPLGAGVGGPVNALVEWDGQLAAGGEFTTAGGFPALRVAAWNGDSWKALGAGLNGAVQGLDVHEGYLAAGGAFSQSGGDTVGEVARWNGSAWEGLGPLVDAYVSDIASWNGDLYAAVGCASVIRWDGATWTEGYCDGPPFLYCLTPTPDQLLFGGYSSAPLEGLGEVASAEGWIETSGESNGPAGPRLNGAVLAAAVYKERVVFGGDFTGSATVPARGLVTWSGAAWEPLVPVAHPNGLSKPPDLIASLGNRVVVAGTLIRAGTVPVHGFAVWENEAWTSATNQSVMFDRYDGGRVVQAKQVYQDQLVLGGSFRRDAVPSGARSIVRWDGTTWGSMPFDAAASPGQRRVSAAGLFGGELVVAGEFTEMCGLPAAGIARFNGTTWSTFPVGLDVYGDMTGVVPYQQWLYIAGAFTAQSTPPVSNLARWNGTTWVSVPSPGFGIKALVVYDDLLYAGGSVSDAGVPFLARISAWDGATWTSVVAETSSSLVSSLVVHNGRLIAGGAFSAIDGTPAANIAAFDGGSWQPLGSGLNGGVRDMTSTGDDLYVIGGFSTAGGKLNQFIARWRDQPVSVIGASVVAAREGTACRLSWRVDDATSVYRVHRAEARGVRVLAEDTRWTGALAYEFVDDAPPSAAFDYWLEELDRTGETTWYGPFAVSEAPPVPFGISASPNPFRGTLALRRSGETTGAVAIDVFDASGRRVRRLWAGLNPPPAEVSWDGRTDSGVPAAAGRYIIRIEQHGQATTVPVVLLR
jgi:hypothetical protein